MGAQPRRRPSAAVRLSRHVRGLPRRRLGRRGRRAATRRDQLPTWRKIVDNPAYNAFWSGQAVQDMLRNATAAGADVVRPRPVRPGRQFRRHRRLPARSRRRTRDNDMVFLALGPWNHGQSQHEALGARRAQAGIRTPAAGFARTCCSPFWDQHLKDEAPAQPIPPVLAFETGANQWRTLPVAGRAPGAVADAALSAAAGGAVAFEPPTASGSAVRGICVRSGEAGSVSRTAGARHVRRRLELEPLAGRRPAALLRPHRRADLRQRAADRAGDDRRRRSPPTCIASTTGTDADWVVKLIDVYPARGARAPRAGRLSADGVGRHHARPLSREPRARPQAIRPGEPALYRVRMPACQPHLPAAATGSWSRSSRAGSRSTTATRRPSSPNIAKAQPEDYRAATQRIWFAPGRQSYIELPVVSAATAR